MPVKKIDFSPLHNVLIRNPDGTCVPMDEPYFESELIAPGTWKIRTDGDAVYLVEGDNEAVVIDSGYGAGNLREYCQSLTQKPVRNIINTHEHFDHTANNAYFEKAYMAKEAIALASIPYKSFEGIDFPRDYEAVAVKDLDVIDLGGRTLTVIQIPDHAEGSIALLDSRERILFSGDEITGLFKLINKRVTDVLEQMKKVRAYKDKFDVIWPGPGEKVEADYIDRLIRTLENIIAGAEGEPGPGFEEKFGIKDHKKSEPAADGRIIYDRFGARPCDMKVDEDARSTRHVFEEEWVIFHPESI